MHNEINRERGMHKNKEQGHRYIEIHRDRYRGRQGDRNKDRHRQVQIQICIDKGTEIGK